MLLLGWPARRELAPPAGEFGHQVMVCELLFQVRVGLLELAALDLQGVGDPGQELHLSAQIVAFGAEVGSAVSVGPPR
ncbi:hypothetical protein ABZV52_30680 [Streptomyces sp. NPDC004735]|uniref:hypothetical protein n=1 Tax=Streptomyces sp. NPDC004735 TaxID=3156654 RepID=UPI0033AD465B